jgi:hypothetical protein
VKPLSEALDWLAGDPAQIAAQAQTWRNVAGSLQDRADGLITQIRLGPASFADDEVLAATIAHEHIHVQQQLSGDHLTRPLRELEDKAYASEGPALERYRNGQR